jgi:hypothetical protein
MIRSALGRLILLRKAPDGAFFWLDVQSLVACVLKQGIWKPINTT